MHDTSVFSGIALTHGSANGPLKNLQAPLSFWGGYDASRGLIVEKSHPCFGQSLAGCIMLMARAKGSSSSSSVLAEAIRHGIGPAGIILSERDLIISVGAIVASELYGVDVPVIVVSPADFDILCTLNANIHIAAPTPAALDTANPGTITPTSAAAHDIAPAAASATAPEAAAIITVIPITTL